MHTSKVDSARPAPPHTHTHHAYSHPHFMQSSLTHLNLSNNPLSGELPPSWGAAMRSLLSLDLSGPDNALRGAVPLAWEGLRPGVPLVLFPGNPELCVRKGSLVGSLASQGESGHWRSVSAARWVC